MTYLKRKILLLCGSNVLLSKVKKGILIVGVGWIV